MSRIIPSTVMALRRPALTYGLPPASPCHHRRIWPRPLRRATSLAEIRILNAYGTRKTENEPRARLFKRETYEDRSHGKQAEYR